MNQTTETHEAVRCNRARRVQAAALTGVAAALVPAAGMTFASPTPEETAGAVVTGLGDDGSSFITTYGLPALGVALGIALLWAILRKTGKRVIGSF